MSLIFKSISKIERFGRELKSLAFAGQEGSSCLLGASGSCSFNNCRALGLFQNQSRRIVGPGPVGDFAVDELDEISR